MLKGLVNAWICSAVIKVAVVVLVCGGLVIWFKTSQAEDSGFKSGYYLVRFEVSNLANRPVFNFLII